MNRADEELMRHHDGEPGAEAPDSDEARAKLEALREVGDAVRAHYTRAEEEAAPKLDALWDRIESGLGPAPAPARRPTLREAFGEWLQGWRGYVAAGALGAAAAAALVLALVDRPVRVVAVDRVVPVREPAPVALTPVRSEDAQVEMLEVAGGTGTVFQIPGSTGEAATTVIWVTRDEPPRPEGPI